MQKHAINYATIERGGKQTTILIIDQDINGPVRLPEIAKEKLKNCQKQKPRKPRISRRGLKELFAQGLKHCGHLHRISRRGLKGLPIWAYSLGFSISGISRRGLKGIQLYVVLKAVDYFVESQEED